MQLLDVFFQDPIPKFSVHTGLYQSFVKDTMERAMSEKWYIEKANATLRSMDAYLVYVNGMLETVKQEKRSLLLQQEEMKG